MGNLQELFLSFDGRIGRRSFWIGALIIIVIGIVLSLILSPILGVAMFTMPDFSGSTADMQAMADQMMEMSRRTGWMNLIAFLILVYPMAAVIIKRRHDRGKSGIEYWVYAGLTVILMLLQGTGIGYGVTEMGNVAIPTPNLLFMVISLVNLALGIFLLVVCGFLKGDAGDNAYGPDPLITSE